MDSLPPVWLNDVHPSSSCLLEEAVLLKLICGDGDGEGEAVSYYTWEGWGGEGRVKLLATTPGRGGVGKP